MAGSKTAVAVAIAVMVVASCGGSSKRVVPPAVAHSSLEFRPVLATFPCSDLHTVSTLPPAQFVLRDRPQTTCFDLGPTLMPGANVAGAQVEVNPATAAWEVNVHFANDDFVTKVATPYVGKQIAIVLDGQVQSAPTIQPGITGQDVTISGDFDEATARRVATEIAPPGTSIDAPTSTTTPLDALNASFRKRCRAVASQIGLDPSVVSGSSMTIGTMRAAFARAGKTFPPQLAKYEAGERLALCARVTVITEPPVGSPTTVCPNGEVVDTSGLTAPDSVVQYAVDADLTATKLPDIKYFLPEGVTIPQPDPCAVLSPGRGTP